MAFLLDTNVLSEVMKREPDPTVIRWLNALSTTQCFLSVLTVGEITKGVELMADGRRKETLRNWLDRDLAGRFRGRILDVDQATAEAWGRLDADARRIGRPLPVIDGLLLATAQRHRLTFVTGDVADCEGRGVPVLDPSSPTP